MSQEIILTEKELFERLAAGDERAFRVIYERHWNKIFALAITYLKSTEQAQDIVQNVFYKVWMQREKMRDIQDPGAFLFIIGRNEMYNTLRKNIARPTASSEALNDLPDDLLLPDRALHLKQFEENIQKAVDRLPPQQQLIFRMSREQGLGHAEIAEKLGIEKSTVKNHMVRALNTLRRYLANPFSWIAGFGLLHILIKIISKNNF